MFQKPKISMCFYIFVFVLLSSVTAYSATITYTYDNLNRLTKVDYGNGSTEDYTYDAAGNRTRLVVSIDNTPPSGSVIINSGANYTNSTTATLTLTCTDSGSGCSQMRFSNDNSNWSTPEDYATTKAWPLSSGDGTKTVYTKFSDGAGNWSNAFNDSIFLDTTAPTTTASPPGGTYTSSQSVTLTCGDGSGSGCASTKYCLGAVCTPTTPYGGSISIPSSNTLRFYSADNIGNNESVKTVVYTIVPPLSITTSSMPIGVVGNLYNQALMASGGIPPYTWSITAGTLPDNLNLSGSTGVIAGTPTTTGAFSFTVKATDTISLTAIKNLSITIYLSQNLPVKIAGSYYSSIQEAYDACLDGNIVEMQIRDTDIYGDIYFDRNVTITLKGGYNSDFTINSSYTRIHGKITISNGKVVTDRIVIQ